MFTSLINLFYPKVCAGCDELLLTGEDVICLVCRHHIPLTNHLNLSNNEVMQKFYGRVPIESASALMYFHKKGIVQKIIHKLKYKNQQDIGRSLGTWYASILENHFEITDDMQIIPVPLHPKKLRERGYNQVTSFARALAEVLHIQLNESLLVRNYYSKTQTKKNLFGRTDIKPTLFEARFSEEDQNKHFILVDDVITTGSTLEACCHGLLKIPGTKITVICMAFSES